MLRINLLVAFRTLMRRKSYRASPATACSTKPHPCQETNNPVGILHRGRVIS